MNSAPGAGIIKKKSQNAIVWKHRRKTQILLHLDIKFHSTDKKEKKEKKKKRNGDEFDVQSKVKEMLFIN